MRGAAIEEGTSTACRQRINASAHAEAPQRQVNVEIGSLRTHVCAAAAPPATEKLLRHAPSGSCQAAAGIWMRPCLAPSGHRAWATPSSASSRRSCQRASRVCGQHQQRLKMRVALLPTTGTSACLSRRKAHDTM